MVMSKKHHAESAIRLHEGTDGASMVVDVRSCRDDSSSRSEVKLMKYRPTCVRSLEGDDDDMSMVELEALKSMFEATDACEEAENHHCERGRIDEEVYRVRRSLGCRAGRR